MHLLNLRRQNNMFFMQLFASKRYREDFSAEKSSFMPNFEVINFQHKN